MFPLKYFFAIALFFSTLLEKPTEHPNFISPLKIPVSLSSGFGDLRVDHFHSGIDIKTQGVTGKEVVASADGYIYRISVSPGGYGRALYLRHAGGYSTVYGHLERFAPDIEEYVKSQQYGRKSFMVMLYPPKDRFQLKQGELIAWSGNSGSSGGPHLHFEVRKTENEIPVHPLAYITGPKDNVAPVIEKIAVYPVDRKSVVNGSHYPLKVAVIGSRNIYSLPPEKEIKISGRVGFGIRAKDFDNEGSYRFNVYSIRLDVDSVTVFNYVMDSFSFYESRNVDSHIDYETFMRDDSYIERAFVLPNDKLGNYRNVINRGIVNFNDNKVHNLKFTVADLNNNKSVIKFRVRSVAGAVSELPKPDESRIMPYNRLNKFSAENVNVIIPSGALYDTLYFAFKKTEGGPEMFSDLYSVHNVYTPVQKAFTIAIKPKRVAAGKESKMLISQLVKPGVKRSYTSTWEDGYLKADVLSFGDYYIAIDTIPPEVSPKGFVNGSNLTGRSELRIRITDEFSGIKSYEPILDGNWALFEYDQKNDVLIYHFDEKRITKGTTHSLALKVSDNANNIKYFSCNFKW